MEEKVNSWYLEVPEPWRKWLTEQLESHPQYWPYMESFHAKEKYASLRAYYILPPELYESVSEEMYNELESFVEFLEQGCNQICSICGERAVGIARIQGWYLTACRLHGGGSNG